MPDITWAQFVIVFQLYLNRKEERWADPHAHTSGKADTPPRRLSHKAEVL